MKLTFTWEVFVLFLALVCFVLATFGVAFRKISLVALGLALWVLVAFLNAAGVT